MLGRSLALLLWILPLSPVASGQSFPSFGGLWSGLGSDFESDLFDGSLPGFNSFGSARRAPCPKYRPMLASEWKMDAAGKVFTADVKLPDIIKRTLRVSLDDDKSVVRVKGLREVSTRRSCLPEDAKITQDGQYEVLEASIVIPGNGIPERVQMKPVHGGVRLHVPVKTPCPPYRSAKVSDWNLQSGRYTLDVVMPDVSRRTLRTSLAADESMIRVTGMRGVDAHARECLPEGARVTQDGQSEILEVAVPVPKDAMVQKLETRQLHGGLRLAMPLKVAPQSSPKAKPERTSQPRFQTFSDVRVEDVPYDWPEKEANAATGYFDARGDFYEY